MCTLTVAWGVFEDEPLVVAANRDEVLDRPATGPTRSEGDLAAVTPRDEDAGGTWIGYNERGLFAGITNRWGGDSEGEPSEPSGGASGDDGPASREGEHGEPSDAAGPEDRRSRGLLVRDALDRPTAREAAAFVERAVERDRYAGFNLLVADGFAGDPPARFADHGDDGDPASPDSRGEPAEDPAAAVYLEYDGALRTRTLEPGVHVVVNVGADGEYVVPPGREESARRQAENADRLRAHLQPEPGEGPHEWRERARDALRDHEFGVCVHRDGFGTRSSSVLSFGEGGVSYEYADGPPCETNFERVEASVRD